MGSAFLEFEPAVSLTGTCPLDDPHDDVGDSGRQIGSSGDQGDRLLYRRGRPVERVGPWAPIVER